MDASPSHNVSPSQTELDQPDHMRYPLLNFFVLTTPLTAGTGPRGAALSQTLPRRSEMPERMVPSARTSANGARGAGASLPAGTTSTDTGTAAAEPDEAAAGVTVTANAEVGDNEGRVEAAVDGDGTTIAFNARYLTDVLQNVDADQFALELNGPLSPGVFRPIGDDQYVHVVMPVRTHS